MSSTVVTLSSSADANAVTRTSRIMIRSGDPLARLAAQIAMYSKTPVCRSTPTMIIMPEQQEDDVPVDSGLVREERVLGTDDPESEHDRRPAQGHQRLVDAVAGNQDVGDHEYGDRNEPPYATQCLNAASSKPRCSDDAVQLVGLS